MLLLVITSLTFQSNIWAAIHIDFQCFFQVGMDKAIGNLTVPLGQLREEVLVRFYNLKSERQGCIV